jgi:hypothetical protein
MVAHSKVLYKIDLDEIHVDVNQTGLVPTYVMVRIMEQHYLSPMLDDAHSITVQWESLGLAGSGQSEQRQV